VQEKQARRESKMREKVKGIYNEPRRYNTHNQKLRAKENIFIMIILMIWGDISHPNESIFFNDDQ
jgi:hypothetical protein